MISIRRSIILIFVFSLIFTSFSIAQDIAKAKVAKDTTIAEILKTETIYVDVPNTSVQIIPPAHFIFMEQAGGFLHVGTSSSIQVQEITGTAYTMITPGLTKDYFKSQGVTLLAEEDIITKSGQKGKLFTVSFVVENVEFERLMFFTGDYNKTIWINANYPVAVKEILNVVLKESLLTAKFKQQ